MRVLVTGSRTWSYGTFVENVLDNVLADNPSGFVLIHGAAHRGVDYIAMRWGSSFKPLSPILLEPHPADWKRYPRAAGLIRNQEMVDLGADLCLAFIRDKSRGAMHCSAVAQHAGIETRIYRWEEIFV